MKWIKFDEGDGCAYYSLEKLQSLDIEYVNSLEGLYLASFLFTDDYKLYRFDDKEDFMKDFENFVINTEHAIFKIEI